MQNKIPLNAVDRLVQSLERRIENYKKNKLRIIKENSDLISIENRKISDAELQLKALRGQKRKEK